jgi:hypothetical protein
MGISLRCLLPLFIVSMGLAQGPAGANPWKSVEDQLGRTGSVQPGDVYKVALPRTDLHVLIGDVEIKPALALGGWVAFKQSSHGAMVMGDLVVTEDEVAPLTLKLQAAGIEQTAIHNHVLHESPRVLYMHIEGHGEASELAKSLHDALAVTELPAYGQWQSCNHRGLRAHCHGGEPCDPCPHKKWNFCDCIAQPHAKRRASVVLHALLGKR